MKKLVTLFLMFFGLMIVAQEEQKPKEENVTIKTDSIKTEVIEVVTSYTPKVTDADKIKRKPLIEFTRNVDKKKLKYTFKSKPVASTFVAQSPKMKTIDVGEKERIYDNYIAAGFGNNITPYLDAYIHHNTAFDSEYGFQLKGIYSNNPVKDLLLNSTYYDVDADFFYKKEDRYFDWTANLKVNRSSYNWYGLPENIIYSDEVINNIESQQNYGDYQLLGSLQFDEDSYFDVIKANVGLFHDKISTTEIYARGSLSLAFPLENLNENFNDLKVVLSTYGVKGNLGQGYYNSNEKAHQLATASIHPYTNFEFGVFNIKFGVKGTFAMNRVSKENKLYYYPDLLATMEIQKDVTSFYLGVNGGVINNSIKGFSDENPYVAPTITVLQTNEKYNFFGGLKGVISKSLNFNIKGGYKVEENKPLFMAYESKSDGTKYRNATDKYLGYEFGNGFNVVYDEVNTISFFGELEYEVSDNVSLGLNGRYNSYSLKEQEHPWNLLQFKSEIFGKYNAKKWYAGANIYLIGGRKGMGYQPTQTEVIDLKGYVDVNLNGGYHLNDMFTIFVKGNNLTNATYQRFNNYNSQGFQVIGGLIWKFDSFFSN